MAPVPASPADGERIYGMDALRGICVILMVIFHLGYDLRVSCGFPQWVLFNPVMTACQIGASWGFILIAGASSRLSHSNLKRGAVVLCCGAAVSAVTFLWGDFVRFGILHFLGCAMLLYGLSHRLWEKIPRRAAPVLYLALFLVARTALPLVLPVPHLYPFGIISPGFRSADYYPLFPWFFWFLFGTWLGGFAAEGRVPGWLRRLRQRQLCFLGRHALAVYFIHQPVLLGVCALIALPAGYRMPF